MQSAAPLRKIIEQNGQLEKLECGHVLVRPMELGCFKPRPAKRRRCWKCADEKPAATPCLVSNETAYGSTQRLSFSIKCF